MYLSFCGFGELKQVKSQYLSNCCSAMHCSQIIPGFPYLEREKGTSCILKQVELCYAWIVIRGYHFTNKIFLFLNKQWYLEGIYYPLTFGMLLSYVGLILYFKSCVSIGFVFLNIGGGSSSPSTKMCQFILVLFQASFPCLKMYRGHVLLVGKLVI